MSTQSGTVRRVEAEIIERSYRVQLLRLSIGTTAHLNDGYWRCLLLISFIHHHCMY